MHKETVLNKKKERKKEEGCMKLELLYKFFLTKTCLNYLIIFFQLKKKKNQFMLNLPFNLKSIYIFTFKFFSTIFMNKKKFKAICGEGETNKFLFKLFQIKNIQFFRIPQFDGVLFLQF